ncbi:MAG: hypothetical protein KDA79_16575 [Planctomycetaceae bacterium]|nr:hypothetical protein [Planctomycetaceae bacterium]
MASTTDRLWIVWHPDRLRLVGTSASSGNTDQPEWLLTIDWPEGTTPDRDTAAAGRLIREMLDARDIKSRQATVIVPRRAAIVRSLQVPPVPENELPELVRLQVESRSVTPADSLVIDFQTGPAAGQSGESGGQPTPAGQTVLAASFPVGQLEQIRSVLTAADLTMERALLGSDCLAAGLDQLLCTSGQPVGTGGTDRQTLKILVAVEGSQAEILLVQQGQLLFSHVCQLPWRETPSTELTARSLTAEVRRAAISAHVAFETATALVLLGPDSGEGTRLARELEKTAKVPTVLAAAPGSDSEAGSAGERIDAATGLGAASLAARPVPLPVDFLHPRRPVVKKDNRRLKRMLVGAAAVLLLGGGWWWLSSYQQELDGQIATLEREIRDLDDVLKRGAPTLSSASEVDGWLSRRRDWLAELTGFAALQPGRDQMYFDRVLLTPRTLTGPARLRATGYARTRADVEDLQQRLAGEGYQIQPQPVRRSDRSGSYPWRFELDLAVPELAAPAAAGTPENSRSASSARQRTSRRATSLQTSSRAETPAATLRTGSNRHAES